MMFTLAIFGLGLIFLGVVWFVSSICKGEPDAVGGVGVAAIGAFMLTIGVDNSFCEVRQMSSEIVYRERDKSQVWVEVDGSLKLADCTMPQWERAKPGDSTELEYEVSTIFGIMLNLRMVDAAPRMNDNSEQ